jgi:hypothetical protein
MKKPDTLPDVSLQEQEQRQEHSSEESSIMERPRTPDDTDTTNDDEETPSPETNRLTEQAHPNQTISTRNVRHVPRLEPLLELSASCRSSSSTMDHGPLRTRNELYSSSRHEFVSHALSEALEIAEHFSSPLELDCKQERQ